MLYLGADHNGYFLKEVLKKYLTSKKIAWKDLGASQFLKTDDFVDYAAAVAKSIKGEDLGLLVCGSGHGMTIAANKVRGTRAILAGSEKSARWGRKEDYANILVLASKETPPSVAKKIVSAFLSTQTGAAQKYLRRRNKIKQLER